jgi:hypothetical protein
VTERVEEPPPSTDVPAPAPPVEDQDAEVARRNTVMGWALFGLFLLLFAGTWLVAFVYLALD